MPTADSYAAMNGMYGTVFDPKQDIIDRYTGTSRADRIDEALSALAAPQPTPPIPTKGPDSGSGVTSSNSSKTNATSQVTNAVKIATSNLFVPEKVDTPIDEMLALVFEDIGGLELASTTKHFLVNGQNQKYQSIQNLNLLNVKYNPQNILKNQNIDSDYFDSFSIKIEDYLPMVGNGVNGSNVYLDTTTNSIVIELINMVGDARVEVQFLEFDSVTDDIIYP